MAVNSLKDKPITKEQALAIKQNVINHDFAPAVNLMFADEIASGKIKQNQFDALISLAYNIGIKGLKGSSVYRYIKQGNFKAAADAFLAWNKGRVNGKLVVLGGLSKRRAKERVSIHAPVWGATEIARSKDCSKNCFNPRTRVGCDVRR